MAPRFTIGRTVLVHGAGYFIPPAVMLGAYYGFGFNTTDEEKRKVLETKYGDKIRKAESNKKNMQEFFNKVKRGDEDLDQRMNDVLLAGNKKVVRHYHIDGDLAANARGAGGGTIGAAAAVASSVKSVDSGGSLKRNSTAPKRGGTRIDA